MTTPLLRHFHTLSNETLKQVFSIPPRDVHHNLVKEELSLALGAALYTPAIHPNLSGSIQKVLHRSGVLTSVICLEDSISDEQVEEGETNVIHALDELSRLDSHPLMFIRVRHPLQIEHLYSRMSSAAKEALSGFVLPKFDIHNAYPYLYHIEKVNKESPRKVYAMPVLETTNVVYHELRRETLSTLREQMSAYHPYILSLRIGATDMLGSYGLRRNSDMTIYDVHVIASAIAAIVNTFGREEEQYIISGPVWEHFGEKERLFKPSLRASTFQTESSWIRRKMINNSLDKLLSEIELDLANGLYGKTIIHPTHADIVNGMLAIPHEEYLDAQHIVKMSTGGVKASAQHTKMNESKPHMRWAKQTISKARNFGVLSPNTNNIQLIQELITAAPHPGENHA